MIGRALNAVLTPIDVNQPDGGYRDWYEGRAPHTLPARAAREG